MHTKLFAVAVVAVFLPFARLVNAQDNEPLWAPAFAYGSGWSSLLILENPDPQWKYVEVSAWRGLNAHIPTRIEFLVDPDRPVVALTGIEGSATTHKLNLPPRSKMGFQLIPDPVPGDGEIVVGYLRVDGGGPWSSPGVRAELIREYRGYKYSSVLTPAFGRLRIEGLKYTPGSRFRPGFAVVNAHLFPMSVPAVVRVYDGRGVLIVETLHDGLPSGKQMSVFLDELFENIPSLKPYVSSGFEGSLDIEVLGGLPLAGVAFNFYIVP